MYISGANHKINTPRMKGWVNLKHNLSGNSIVDMTYLNVLLPNNHALTLFSEFKGQ